MSKPTTTDDSAKADAFAGQLLGTLNRGALGLMTSVGHRTGLFDAMSALPPSTSEEIAARSKLQERYVREWLGAMVTGGVVELDPASTRFRLPAEHAAFLTRAAGANNLAVFAQFHIEHPVGTLIYTVSCMHCMTVSLAQGGEGLGAMWGEEKTREYLQRAGFRSVETHQLAHDIQNNWYVIRS